jgi:hypothetical protein
MYLLQDVMIDEKKEMLLIHKIENLYHFLHGAHNVCDHENSSSTFHQACHAVQEIINFIKN